MFKFSLLISLLFSVLAFAEDGPSNAIFISDVIRDRSLGVEVEPEMSFSDIAGSLESEFIDLEISFELRGNNVNYSSQDIAQSVYLVLFKSNWIGNEDNIDENGNYIGEGPFPCGGVILGRKEQKALNDTTYKISAGGDGFINTCTGNGAPGSWNYSVTVNYDTVLNKGILTIESGEE